MNLTDARFLLTLLICPQKKLNADLSPLVAKALPLAPIQNLTGYPSRPQMVDLLRTFPAKICFLEFTDTPTDAFNALETLRVLAPDLPVIAVLSGNRQELVLECLRRGASEFLTVPLSAEQLDACLTRVMRLVRTPTDDAVRGKLLAVMPAKAASGATTLSCALASAAKKKGKTLLVDLDPLTGTVSFLLRLKSGYSFMDVLQRSSQLDGDLWKQMVTASNGFDVLLAPEGAVDPTAELASADAVLGYAQTRYDTVVADLAPTPTGWNLSVARACDQLLLVCTTDLLSLHAAQRVLAWLERSDIDPDKIRLVVNQHAKTSGLQLERVPVALNREPFAVLPADVDAIARSLMEAKPAGAASPFGKEVAKLVDKLLPDSAEKPASTGKEKAGLLAGLFGRR